MIAKHDGTECYPVSFTANGELLGSVLYYPVPGGVVMQFDNPNQAVFIPMCRLEAEVDADGKVLTVRLLSTLGQLMQGATLASLAAASMMEREGG